MHEDQGKWKAYGSLRWRLIGPHRGGRVVAVAGHPTERNVFYFGSTGGGVWRTTNAGVTWENISDGFLGSASVGALAVAPSDPNVLYLGMGESCIRGNVSVGDGFYRSTDGGRTWQHMGLRESEHIARIRVHPTRPELVYVAVLGHAFDAHPERGVYRSQDGGRTFSRVLYRDEDTGAIDLSMDPHNPRLLFATLWQARRSPWHFESGGPGSGLFRSWDGGDTWEEISRRPGLPSGTLGRMGVAVSPARPGRVWAIVEAEEGGVFRSDDYGDTWERVNGERGPRSRPWYYSHIFADPQDPDTVYVLATTFWKSVDGGRTFQAVPTPHGDHHDLWIDPQDPRRLICGADGGAMVSLDGGHSWSSIYNQPTAEFYHVTTDTRFPYRVYGAQQDNTTLCLPSRSDSAAIGPREWYDVGGAESGYIAVRPDDPDVVYAGSSGGGEGGRITRYDHRTREQRDISVWPEQTAGMAAEEYTYRFQWTSPIVLSPHDPNVLYSCGNRVFRSRDEGQSWEVLSPDLTRNDPSKLGPSGGLTPDHTGVEVYCTIFSFAESPVQRGLLWAGTDDGLVHVSRDDGKTWENVTPPELPAWATVSMVEPSHHDAQVVYLSAHRYRLGDRRPYLFRSTDGGRTWQSIAHGIPEDDYVRVIREDPEVPGLLYVGSEHGVYVSLDDGAHWSSLRLNLPVVPVHDLAVAGTDLVAATHGRSFWILDDITVLRQLAKEGQPQGVRLFAPRDTVRAVTNSFLMLRPETETWKGMAAMELPEGTSHYLVRRPEPGEAPEFLDAGQNPPPGVLVHYVLPEGVEGEVTLTIRDGEGQEVISFSSRRETPGAPKLAEGPGAHRFVWDMRYPAALPPQEGKSPWTEPVCRPLAAPGTYTVELAVGGETQRASFRIVADPRVAATDEDLRARFQLEVRIRDRVSEVNEALTRLRRLARDLEGAKARLGEGHGDLVSRLDAARAELGQLEAELTQVRWETAQDDIAYPGKLDSQLVHLFQVVSSGECRPTRQAFLRWEDLSNRVLRVQERLGQVVARCRELDGELARLGWSVLSSLGEGSR